jgi:hypothetical protein
MSIRVIAIVVLSTCWSVAAGAQTSAGSKLSPGKVALLVQPKGIADVEILGTVLDAQLAANLPQLIGNLREPDTPIFASIAAMAVRQTPGALDSIAASMATSASGRVWGDFLNRLVNVDAKVIESGLASADPAVREGTIWFVVGDAQPSRTVQIADVKVALATPLAAPRPDDTEWAAFGRELIERRLGKGDVTDRSDLIKARAKERYALTTLLKVPELTTQERVALSEVLPAPAAKFISRIILKY